MTRIQQEMDELFEFFWLGRMRSNLLFEGPKKKDLVKYSRLATYFYEAEKEHIIETDKQIIRKEDIHNKCKKQYF